MFIPNNSQLKWLSKVRRDFHTHPELSFEETQTTDRICDLLAEMGIKANHFPESTGATALVKGKGYGPCLGLRADIDALPIQQKNEVPYKSISANKMHACGHDANTAIMLGVARSLTQSTEDPDINGSTKFIFQPAEERSNGAQTIIRQGVLEGPRVDLVFAGHMEPDLDVGTIGIFKGTGYAAADLFYVTITGQGGHGGRPHKTRDPLTAGAYFVTALQTLVARNMNPMDPAVVSLGKFHSGAVGNIIPESAVLEGTIRTHSTSARNLIIKRLTELTKGLEALFDVKCQLEIEAETPCCTNDEQLSLFLYDIGSDLLGKNRVKWLPPTMGSEDFAFFARERPSAIVRLGCRNTAKGITAPLHSPYFDIDEAVLDIGVQFFYKALTTYLTSKDDHPT